MATEWVKLTELTKNGGRLEIYVNLEQASSIQRSTNNKYTTIWFLAGQKNGVVKVDETPQKILESANKVNP